MPTSASAWRWEGTWREIVWQALQNNIKTSKEGKKSGITFDRSDNVGGGLWGAKTGGQGEWCEDYCNVHIRNSEDCTGRRNGDIGIDLRMIQPLLCMG